MEALQILRNSKFHKSVILVAEEGDTTTDEEAGNAGFDAVLRKPYSSLQLSELIATQITPGVVKMEGALPVEYAI